MKEVNFKKRVQAFTLVELMIAVAIIGILAAVVISQYGKYIQNSKTNEAKLQLRKIIDGAMVTASNGTKVVEDGGSLYTCIVSPAFGSFETYSLSGGSYVAGLPPSAGKGTKGDLYFGHDPSATSGSFSGTGVNDISACTWQGKVAGTYGFPVSNTAAAQGIHLVVEPRYYSYMLIGDSDLATILSNDGVNAVETKSFSASGNTQVLAGQTVSAWAVADLDGDLDPDNVALNIQRKVFDMATRVENFFLQNAYALDPVAPPRPPKGTPVGGIGGEFPTGGVKPTPNPTPGTPPTPEPENTSYEFVNPLSGSSNLKVSYFGRGMYIDQNTGELKVIPAMYKFNEGE